MNKLRVWWIPQVPMDAFRVGVDSVEEGVRLMNILADYDDFQFKNGVKPDYANTGGLEMLEDGGEWTDWFDEETGEGDPELYIANLAS